MIYLLDANTFIQAKNLHYRMKVVPGFWEWLTFPHENIILQSILPIYNELTPSTRTPDKLSIWAKNNRTFFQPVTNQEVQEKFAEIGNSLNNQPTYSQSEIARFLSGADLWLIAAASVFNAKIVTHEVPVPHNSKKVKIPNLARTFDIECLDIFDLLELSQCQLIRAKQNLNTHES